MTKTLTSYLQLDEFTKNQDKLIFLFVHTIPNEIKELLPNCPLDVIIIDPNIFEALNKKYNINSELTLLFFDHNFIIYQSSNQQSIINFLRMKNF